MRSDVRLLVLHGARVRGSGDSTDIADLVGLEPAVVEAELQVLAGEGFVQHRDGSLRGWVPTAAGRAEQVRRLGDELDAAGCRPAVEAAYRRFRVLNPELLDACTAWQLRDGAVNDHRDAAHDRSAIERLVSVHRQVQPVLDRLEACLARFARYRPRLDHAAARVLAGETEWFAKPVVDSYHTVWFQLHEDLLNTLGIDRVDERDKE